MADRILDPRTPRLISAGRGRRQFETGLQVKSRLGQTTRRSRSGACGTVRSAPAARGSQFGQKRAYGNSPIPVVGSVSTCSVWPLRAADRAFRSESGPDAVDRQSADLTEACAAQLGLKRPPPLRWTVSAATTVRPHRTGVRWKDVAAVRAAAMPPPHPAHRDEYRPCSMADSSTRYPECRRIR